MFKFFLFCRVNYVPSTKAHREFTVIRSLMQIESLLFFDVILRTFQLYLRRPKHLLHAMLTKRLIFHMAETFSWGIQLPAYYTVQRPGNFYEIVLTRSGPILLRRWVSSDCKRKLSKTHILFEEKMHQIFQYRIMFEHRGLLKNYDRAPSPRLLLKTKRRAHYSI